MEAAAYVIVERDGEWSVVRIQGFTSSVGLDVSSRYVAFPHWIDNVPCNVTVSGLSVDHAHQLETLEEVAERIKHWIARDAARRLKG